MNDPRTGMGATQGTHGTPIPHSGPPSVPHAGTPTMPHAPTMPQRMGTVPPRPAAPAKPADDRIELVDEPAPKAPAAPGAGGPAKAPDASKGHVPLYNAADMAKKEDVWQRPLRSSPSGATRVRSFHGRLSDQGLDYMDHTINEWLDKHPEVDVKFVTSITGIYEGKIREPAVILNVWY